MERSSQDAPQLPRGPAADPDEGHRSGSSAASDHTDTDAARTSWQPAKNGRPAWQAQLRPPASDPDDAKTAPEPAIKVRPVQPARPSAAGTSQMGTSPASNNPPARATPPLGASSGPSQSMARSPGASTGPAPAKAASAPGSSSGPLNGALAGPPPGNSGPSNGAAASPPRGNSGPPPRNAASQPPRMGADPDDAKTAPQPAIRIRPVPEIRPVQAQRDSGRVGYDEHGFVPGLSRPKEPYGRTPRTQAAQPSWLTILATTVRLWLKRRASRDRGARKTVVTRPRVQLAVLALVIFGAAVLGLALAGNGTKAPRPGQAANPVLSAQAARSQAAAWISAQAGRNTIVSCDPVMCAVLLAHGFPAGNLDRLGPDAPDPLASDLIVATGVLRSQFGSRLGSVYAPVILASFGTGSADVDIRVVSPDGAVAYTSQFRADRANRQTVGAQFLRNSRIVVDPSARRQLVSGMVDSRLLVTLATMADQVHPLQILTFGGASRGASPGVPLRTAVIFGATSGSTGSSAVLRSLRAFLLAQQPPFLPASTQIVPVAAGQSALRIQFAAPSPLGVLGGNHPVVKIPTQ
jgi:hypothetical protein